MTNFEKIKNMSVEEMARECALNVSCSNCRIENLCSKKRIENLCNKEQSVMLCREIWKQWLESEVKNEADS